MKYIGIDPGKNGAIVILNKNEDVITIETHKIPLIKREYNIAQLCDILDYRHVNCHIVLEQVHALFQVSAAATFNFGYGFGLIEGIVNSYKIPYILVPPRIWQKEMFQGVTEIKKPNGRIDTKAMALIATQRLYPSYIGYKNTVKDQTISCDKRKKINDGIIDALLLATYAMRKFS